MPSWPPEPTAGCGSRNDNCGTGSISGSPNSTPTEYASRRISVSNGSSRSNPAHPAWPRSGPTSMLSRPWRWINAWMRWPTQCVSRIPAAMNNAAPMRSGRWPGWKRSWCAGAGVRNARPRRTAPPLMRPWCTCWPRVPRSTVTRMHQAICPAMGSCPPNQYGIWPGAPRSNPSGYPGTPGRPTMQSRGIDPPRHCRSSFAGGT
nr:hypothetical protein CPGR_02636 [Mycolicibacter nonchromogenicus]